MAFTAGAVHAGGVEDPEASDRLGEDRFAFALREPGVRLVTQAGDRPALVVVAHPALEAGIAADARIEQPGAERGGVERRFGKPEARHLSHRTPAG